MPVAALFLLCFLWSLNSLRSDLLPQFPAIANQGLMFLHQALPLALLAIASSFFALVRRSEWPRGKELRESVLIGLGLFVAPAVLTFFATSWLSDLTRVALFSLVPVFAVIFEPYLGNLSREQSKSGLMASLVAVAGTSFLFPIDVPQSVRAGYAFGTVVLAAACIASANCRAVRLASGLTGKSIAPLAAIAGASASIGLFAVSAILERGHWNWTEFRSGLGLTVAWMIAVELPALALLFWLMRYMSATRMTTRFLFAPLIANLLGLIFLRPAVNIREWLGLLLVAGGASWLLLAKEDEPEMTGSSLKLDLDS